MDTGGLLDNSTYFTIRVMSSSSLLPFQDGQTVLHLAAGAGHLDTVEALLDRGCDANVQDFVSCKSVWMRWAANLHVLDWPHCAAESGLRRSLEYREVTAGPGRQPRPPGRTARQHGAARGGLEGVQRHGGGAGRQQGEL